MAFYNSKFLFEHEYVPIFSIKCQYFPTITNMMPIWQYVPAAVEARECGCYARVTESSEWASLVQEWLCMTRPAGLYKYVTQATMDHPTPCKLMFQRKVISGIYNIWTLKETTKDFDGFEKNRMQLLPCEWVCPPLKKFPPVTVVVSERVAEQLIQRLSPFSNQLWKGKIFQPHLLCKERFSNISSFGRERFSNLASCGLEDFPTSLALGRK